MMNWILDFYYEVFLEQGQFIEGYQLNEKLYKERAFYVTLIASFVSAVSMVYLKTQGSSGFILTIFSNTFMNYFFLGYTPHLMGYLIHDRLANSEHADTQLIVCYAKSLNMVYFFTIPLSVFFVAVGINSFSGFIAWISILGSVYIYLLSGFISKYFGLSFGASLKITIRSYMWILFLPSFFILYFISAVGAVL